MNKEEKTMKSEKIYEGRILTLKVDTVELPNRSYSRREIVEHANCVVMIPMIDSETVLMVKQYRKAVEQVLLEFPAGKIDAGEDSIEAAKRELAEETGYNSDRLDFIYDFYTSPGFTNEKISLFLANDLYEEPGKTDEGEFIDLVHIKVEDLIKKLDNYELIDAKTIIAALYLKNQRK